MNLSYVEIINSIIRFIFVIYSIHCLFVEKRSYKRIILCFFAYIIGDYLITTADVRGYVLQILLVICIFLVYLLNTECKKLELVSKICFLLSIYEITNLISIVCSGIIVYFVQLVHIYAIEQMVISAFIIRCLLLGLFVYIIKIYLVKGKELGNVRSIFLYALIGLVKIPFLYTDMKNLREFKLLILFSICATVIFLIISRIDKHNAEKERAKIEENNKKLSSKLHKSQEILPAMVQVLSNVTENGAMEMEEQDAHKLLEEVSNLYGQQLKENSKEDLQLKNFCSTGLKLLDEQLKVYQMEALDRNVNLDIFVQAPINDIIKKDNIDQLKLQRAVGDLIRNAFRVLEREDKKCHAKGHILLIIGCRLEDILEIAVVDNGAEFPLHVIQAFGSRGVTTGGTGNGLADLVEFADEIKASIRVDEFAWETSSFAKKVSIIFDKQRMNYFNSSRRELIESSFWNNN